MVTKRLRFEKRDDEPPVLVMVESSTRLPLWMLPVLRVIPFENTFAFPFNRSAPPLRMVTDEEGAIWWFCCN